ncbi:MAG TPA: right-handed parallel beta-helix repeat-containing protein [Anaerolineales bacterium]|nr:right-handed parallel beta-helix repeat-containing protein [Anaerolineales bacterium]
MKGQLHLRSFFLSLTIIAVLLFSAMGTTAAYADDGTKTDPAPTEETTGGGATDEASAESASSESAEGESKDSQTDVTTEVSVDSSEVAAVEEVTTAESATGAATVDTPILEQVPENTTVAVLDAQGQPQPLATAASADAIAVTSDPIWCPAGQAPTPGANGCTASFTSFDALLTELAGNATYTGAGTIYVQQGAYAGGESTIDFNSYNLSNISGSDLTVQGGWNTSTGDTSSTSTFNISLILGSSANPWGGSVTLNNLSFNGTNGTGITVYSQANINLTNVQSSASVTGSGAELTAGGDVNINDSSFDRNREAGAIVNAGGNVSVANSSFSNPTSARLQMTGLDITSGGNVSLLDVIADGNREVGAIIDAGGRVSIFGTIDLVNGTSTTSFSGTKSSTTTTCPGSPSQFCGFGLQVTTPGSIDLQGVIGNDNFLWGANLNAGQDVNIVDSIFNANSTEVPTFIDDTGIFITAGGNVSLNNVTANDNRLFGASIDAVGNVSVNNSNFLSNNGVTVSGSGATQYDGIGLQVNSDSGIFINNTNASGNSLFGADLTAGGDVAIANSIFSNTTTGDTAAPLGMGLQIVSGQNVFIDTVTLDGNQVDGASIQATGDVFLDFITATNNGANGVEVDAACTNLNSGTYSGNGEYGLSLVNPTLNQLVPPVFSGNGLGDINPAAPGACPPPVFPVVDGGTTNGGATGGVSTLSGSISNRNASFVSMSNSSYKNLGLINSGALTLNNLFAGNYQLLGVSSTSNGNVTALGIFTGKYAYVHSAQGLQIVFLTQPAIFSGLWSNES